MSTLPASGNPAYLLKSQSKWYDEAKMIIDEGYCTVNLANLEKIRLNNLLQVDMNKM